MKRYVILSILLLVYCGVTNTHAQTMPKEELIFLTSEWKGERFPDGRPKIPDDLIRRAKSITVEDAWTVLRNDGYICQYDGNWKMVHPDVTIAGRALTAMFMPTRPDVEKNIKDRGAKQGRTGNTNAWPIDVLSKGDVYVADGFGKIKEGTLMGDNLGNSIYAKSGTGVIFDAAARDLDGLMKIEGFNAFVRDWHPSFLQDVVLMGLNTPIRIGQALVLPGDLVLAKKSGVIFIPAHYGGESCYYCRIHYAKGPLWSCDVKGRKIYNRTDRQPMDGRDQGCIYEVDIRKCSGGSHEAFGC